MQELVGMSLAVSSHKRAGSATATPPSRVRRLSDKRGPGEGDVAGLPVDKIAERVFSSIAFSKEQTVCDGEVYTAVSDENVRGSLFRLFGPRLSVAELEYNLTSLEAKQWGWLEGSESCVIDLRRDVAHQRVSELCVLALSSLSPAIVTAVTAVLTTLADSIQRENVTMERHSVQVNLFTRADASLLVVNSRLDCSQSSSKLLLCLCGSARLGMQLSLQVRRIGFSSVFQDHLRTSSPALKVKGGTVLLPPSPELHARALTAPSSVPSRFKHSSRAAEAQRQMVELSASPETSRHSPIRLPAVRLLHPLPEVSESSSYASKDSPASVVREAG